MTEENGERKKSANDPTNIDELIAQSQKAIDSWFATQKANAEAASKRIMSMSNYAIASDNPYDNASRLEENLGAVNNLKNKIKYKRKIRDLDGLGLYLADGVADYAQKISEKTLPYLLKISHVYDTYKTKIYEVLSKRRNLKKNRRGINF